MTKIEDRVRRLEGRAALDDLVVRYFLASDGDNLEGVGASTQAHIDPDHLHRGQFGRREDFVHDPKRKLNDWPRRHALPKPI